jgi:aspartate racemase
MKTIGLIGGMSWESTALYYQSLNRGVQEKLGGVHSCKCVLYSVDFADISAAQHKGDWKALGHLMVNAAKSLEAAGAEGILICTNTMHKLASLVEDAVAIPLLHIVDATAEKIQEHSLKKLGFIATRFSMEGDFLTNRYQEKFGIQTIIPNAAERDDIHRIIYEELVKGIINEASRAKLLEIMISLKERGAEGIILGCTEIELLVSAADLDMPLFPTAKLHSEKAIQWALR